MATLPGAHWTFEKRLLGVYDLPFVGFEKNDSVYKISKKHAPSGAALYKGDVFKYQPATVADAIWLDLNGWVRKSQLQWLKAWAYQRRGGYLMALTFLSSRFKGETREDRLRFGGDTRAWVSSYLGEPRYWINYNDTIGMIHGVWMR